MKKCRTLIIDGYNAIHRIPRFRRTLEQNLEASRDALIQYCLAWKSQRGDFTDFYVVFDGNSSVGSSNGRPPLGIHTIYTRTGESADNRIFDVIGEPDKDHSYVVVSDDGEVKQRAEALQFETMSVKEFGGKLKQQRHLQNRENDSNKDLSPRQQKQINDELKHLWGLDE